MITSREVPHQTSRTSQANPLSEQTDLTHKMEFSQRVNVKNPEKSEGDDTKKATGMSIFPKLESNNN